MPYNCPEMSTKASRAFSIALLIFVVMEGLFLSAFLLTKQELGIHSAADDWTRLRSLATAIPDCHTPPSPHTPVKESRVLLFIVDALRADFFLAEDAADTHLDTQSRTNMSDATLLASGAALGAYAFPLLHAFSRKHPDSVSVLRQFSEPPTTTAQRIKAFTTGTVPTKTYPYP